MKNVRNQSIRNGCGTLIALSLAFGLTCSTGPLQADRISPDRPIHLSDTYHHEKYVILPETDDPQTDIVKRFRAYTSLFDGPDDDDKDGDSDLLGIPHSVTYELKSFHGKPRPYKRPRTWMTDNQLATQGIAPRDSTYHYSQSFRQSHPNWYVRGHLCMKNHAARLGAQADWNTHTLINAVPQRRDFNSGIWLDLENMTAKWADTYNSILIVDGPIFDVADLDKAVHIGEPHNGEMQIAAPDRLFKIVTREGDNKIEVLAFIYPQDVERNPPDTPYPHTLYLTSVDEIEALTGFDFVLPDDSEPQIESEIATQLWPTKKGGSVEPTLHQIHK